MRFVSSLLFLASLHVYAGGFYLNVKPVSVTNDAKAKDAAFVAFLAGCHDAEKGTVTAVAEGVVDGKRQSVPLKVVALDKAGWFAVQLGPQAKGVEKGNWVLVVSGRHPAFTVSTVASVPVSGGKIALESAKHEHREAR
jgi:hypothetical protein